jgi:hypothetical protein
MDPTWTPGESECNVRVNKIKCKTAAYSVLTCKMQYQYRPLHKKHSDIPFRSHSISRNIKPAHFIVLQTDKHNVPFDDIDMTCRNRNGLLSSSSRSNICLVGFWRPLMNMHTPTRSHSLTCYRQYVSIIKTATDRLPNGMWIHSYGQAYILQLSFSAATHQLCKSALCLLAR